MTIKKIAIASDHAGFSLKSDIIKHLQDKNIDVKDLGTFNGEAVDYPEYGHKIAQVIENEEYKFGISICGTGNGISMTTNKHPKIRAGICWNEEIARLIRSHNDANICSIPARFVDKELALRMVDIFLSTEFDGGRHLTRIQKIPIKK